MISRCVCACFCILILSGCGDSPTPSSGTGGATATGSATGADTTSAPRTLIVDSKPGSAYTSVVQAVRDAGPQDTIKVRPGTYVGSTVMLSKSMTLIGEGKANEIVIQCDKSNAVIANGDDIRISSVTLISNSDLPALHVLRGKFSLQDCTLTSKKGTGAFLGGLVQGTVTHNLFTGSKVGLELAATVTAEKNMISENEIGVKIYGPSCTFKDNRVAQNSDNGILVNPSEKPPRIESNEIYLNKGSGIDVLGKVDPVICKNKIHDNRYSGVVFDTDSSGVCEENEIQHCHVAVRAAACLKAIIRNNKLHDNYCGVFADVKGAALVDGNEIWKSESCGVYSETGGDLTVTHNSIHDNTSNGCCAISSMRIEDNDIFHNWQPGILIQEDATCQVRRNKLHDHLNWAISTYGKGVIEDNDLLDNAQYGIMIRPKAATTIRKNRIKGNREFGVYIDTDGGGTFEDNDVTGNYFGAYAFEGKAPNFVRARNKIDPCPISRARIGDWIEVTHSLKSSKREHHSRTRMVLLSKGESEASGEKCSWEDGKEPQKATKRMPLGGQRTCLSDFIAAIEIPMDSKELDHGEETLTVNGKPLQTAWTRYEIRPDGKPLEAPIVMKVWTAPEVPLDDTVKAVINLPNNAVAEYTLLAFGDANTPKPAPPVPAQRDPLLPLPPPPDAPPAKAPVEKPAAPSVPAAEKPRTPKISVIHCKDGREFRATLVIQTGDQYSFKDDDGKFQTLNKDDVTDVTKE